MSDPTLSSAAQNPFSTRCIRPGAIDYIFPPGVDASSLVQELRRNGWRGQIIGAHGSGKSALLAALIPVIERAGKPTCTVELCDGQRRLPINLRRTAELDRCGVLIVDGYEQLGRLARFSLSRFCRRRRIGLLVTSHTPVGLPELFRTRCSIELARRIVDRLLVRQPGVILAEDVARVFQEQRGNLRETLLTLYDLYQQHRAPFIDD